MAQYAFFRGEIVPIEDAKISIMTHAFLYGTACFEGIRSYWCNDRQTSYIFRLQEHYERLLNSCKILQIQSQYSLEDLCQQTVDLTRKSAYREDVYIRPIFYKSSEIVGVRLNGLEDDFLMFVVPFGPYLDLSKGLKVCVSSWRHIEDNVIPMRAKVNGAYVNAALAKSEALLDGYDEAIFLTSSGQVSEGSAENLFIIRQGRLVTPPVTASILEGITRATIIELARDVLGVETVERSVDRTELYTADEAFFVGTGAQVSPIAEIDHRQIGSGEPGPISKEIQDLYFQVVKNKVAKYSHWCTPVKTDGEPD